MLGGEIEQFCRGAAEDVGLFVVAERCRGENMVYGMQLPGIRIIAAQHDLTGADLGRQTDPTPRGRYTIPTPYGGPQLPIEPPH